MIFRRPDRAALAVARANRPDQPMTDAARNPPTKPASGRPAVSSAVKETFEVVRTVGVGLLAALTLHTVLFQPFTIPSSSMEPGLVVGDYLVVSKPTYGWGLASLPVVSAVSRTLLFERQATRGDVVVFRLPRDPKQTWIKRIIGLPGDRVQVTAGQVFINGRGVPQAPLGLTRDHDAPERIVEQVRETLPSGRTYVTYDGSPGRPGDDTGVYVVPKGQYLVMGDNRDNSLDGRFPAELGVGLLPEGNLIGRAEWVLASWEPGASLLKPWTWFRVQPDRFFRQVR